MKDLEKQIEKAADIFKSGCFQYEEATYKCDPEDAFIEGAKSPEAKEYWQQGMYTEEEVKILCDTAYYKGASDELNLGEFHTATQHIESFKIWFDRNKKK